MDAGRQAQLREFVAYAKTLKGDEKGEAQVFLDRLFRGFSRFGYKEAGAVLEDRVKDVRGGTRFADLVWKPIVLIEMKKRGEDLSRHLQQAFDYWTRLVPNRPRYVVLCNFDEFRVYDFDQNINEPQDTLTLDELPERYGPLNFLWPTNEPARFRVDREKATREAAGLLAAVFKRLRSRPEVGAERAQRFVLQTLVCFFSEDIGLLPKHFFTQLLDECIDPPKAFDLLDGLFRAMNTREGTRGGRFVGVPYFNGGLFSESSAVELDPRDEVARLKQAATYNWAHVSPDIFGTIFQKSLDQDERHALGAHYTSHQDIMKIVKPTIIDPFTTAIEGAQTLKDLAALQRRLQTLRVLDPACGSGNFLYIAYREMRRLEAAIVVRQNEISKKQDPAQMALGGVSPRQFFGMDILPFAVELAKVTLSIAPKLASDELHTPESPLPLANLDKNIECKDALIDAKGGRALWPEADVIIGNPPFLGSRYFAKERGYPYVRAVHEAYPEVPKMADYCVYWFRRASDYLPTCTADDPFAGRAGLVGTQNIRNNQSRVGGLDEIARTGVIIEAVENQPWSGEANVHVSIANWVKTDSGGAGFQPAKVEPGEEGKAGWKPAPPQSKITIDEPALLIPSPRKLWRKVDPNLPLFESEEGEERPKTVTPGKCGGTRKDKSFELEARLVEHISSALSDELPVETARILACNREPKKLCYVGQYPFNEGFMLEPAAAKALIRKHPVLREVMFPYMIGRDLLEDVQASRWIIDFGKRDLLQAASYPEVFDRVKELVMPTVLKKAKAEQKATGKDSTRWTRLADRWWQFRDYQPGTMEAIGRVPRYIVCSRVTKRPVFAFLSKNIHPDNALMVFPLADDYSFGLLQSNAHWQWFVAKCSKLKSDFRYTPESVFDTFPWPQAPTKKQVRAVAAAGREIRKLRDLTLPSIKGGLRALYRTLELPGDNSLKDAHANLDAAVLDAYGFAPRKDLLKQLLDLNLAVAANLERGVGVTAPGVPTTYGDPHDLITEDCIQP